MSQTILERSTVPIPTTQDRRVRFKRLAPAALTLLVAVGAAKYGHYWWTVARFIERPTTPMPAATSPLLRRMSPGFVGEILVKDNQRVDAGQLLVRLDARDFRAALDRAQAIADQRQAALASLEAKYALQQTWSIRPRPISPPNRRRPLSPAKTRSATATWR